MHYRGAVAVSVGSAESDPSDKKRRSKPFLLTLKNYLLQRVGNSVSMMVLLGVIGLFLLFSATFLTSNRSFRLESTRQPRGERKSLSRSSKERGYSQKDILDWNPIYRVQEAMEIVGDRSDDYARLRKKIDDILPHDPERSQMGVHELTKHSFHSYLYDIHHGDSLYYDIYNCPDHPPLGYPFAWNLMKIFKNWPAADTNPRSRIYQGLCVFDYQKDYQKALAYRQAEVPFVVINDPAVARTVERWNVPGE